MEEGDRPLQRIGRSFRRAEPHVIGVVVQVQVGVCADRDQCGVQALALPERDQPVGAAVQQQDRRRAGRDVADRAGQGGQIRDAGGGRAQQLRLPGGGVERIGSGVGGHRRDVAGRVPGNHRADRARSGDSDGAVECCVTGRQSEQFGEVAAGGLAPGGDASRIDPDLAGPCPQPADCGLRVMQWGGKGGLAGKSVVDAGHRDSRLRNQFEGVRGRAGVGGSRAVPAAQSPAAAVQEDHDGHVGRRGRRQPQVQLERPRSRHCGVRHAGQHPHPACGGSVRRQRRRLHRRRADDHGRHHQASGHRVVGHEFHPVLGGGRLHPGEVGDERRLLGRVVVGRRAHVLEEALEPAGHHTQDPSGLFDPIGVWGAGRHIAEIARSQQPGSLGALGIGEEQPHLAVENVERLMGLVVRMGGDDVAGRAVAGDHAELAGRLVARQQHGEKVGEQHRVFALATAEYVRLGSPGQRALPLRSLIRVHQVFETHRVSRQSSSLTCKG